MTQLDVHFFDRPMQTMRKSAQGFVVMIVAIGADLTAQRYAHFSSPGLFLLPAIAVVGMIAGLSGALMAAGISVVFVAAVYAQNGSLFHANWDRLARLGVMCISAPLVACVVGVLQRRTEIAAAGQLNFERNHAAMRARSFEIEKANLLSLGQLSQQRANDLIDSVPGVVWETVIAGDLIHVVFVSSYAERLLGYPVREWTTQPDFWQQIIHPDDRASVASQIATIWGGGGGGPLEFRWMDQHGIPCWVETRLVRLMSGNHCTGFRAVTLDINQRKQLEHSLRQRATELAESTESLKRSNEELDQFAYVTSHDLKAPLRGIFNLSQWIEEDLGDRFTSEASGQMRLLRGRVQRMESLINGLLEYAHVGRTQGKLERVDTGKLLADVIDWIGAPPDVRIEIAPGMPVFQADAIRLQQVFTNLLGNAVKHGRPAGRIGVDYRVMDRFYEFAVIDDGNGIDPQHHERIFGIFQTLRPRDEVEGTGIGLSLVKRIVESKGGVVSVESRTGHGATFRFTWPRNEGGDFT